MACSQIGSSPPAIHDDVIKWKYFPCYWPFVRGIPRSPVNSPHKGQWRGALMFFGDLSLNKQLSKQSRRRSFKTPSCSLWRHCNASLGSFSCSNKYLYPWGNIEVRKRTHQKGTNILPTLRPLSRLVCLVALTHLPRGQNGRHFGRQRKL